MASSKKNKTPQDQAIAAKRVQFVKANPNLDPAEARKRFFVQTRAAELQAKGVEVTKQKRQELRQKFATGGVQRQGFYTPGDLQRIAAAKAASGKVGATNTDQSATPSTRPQDLADYKNTVYSNLAKENTARRPVAPKKPDFDKYSWAPSEFLDSPFAKGVVSATKWTGGAIKDVGESLAASSINPVLNIPQKFMANIKDIKEEGIKRVFWVKGGKNYEAAKANPNFREAGIVEKTVNIAPLEIAPAVAIKGVKAFGGKIAGTQYGKNLLSITTEALANKGGKQVVQGTADYAATALSNLGKGGKTGTVDLITGAYRGPVKNAATSKVAGEVVTGVDDYLKATLKANKKSAKSGTVDLLTGKYQAPVKTTTKVRAKGRTGPKDAAGKPYTKMKDIDVDAKFGNPAEQAAAKNAKKVIETPAPKASTPKTAAKPKATAKPKISTAKPAVAKPVAPKATKPKVDRFANAWDDSPIDMNKVDFSEFIMESSKPYSTARRATVKKADDVAPAPAPKTPAKKTPAKKSAPKTTVPKANAKVAFDKSVAPIKAGSQTKLTFKTQAEYNQFLKTGGKERLRQMSPELRTSFERVNEKWIKGATEARQAAEAAQKNTAARVAARKARYDRARPALKAKFNEALIRKQERELLAKVTKKK